MKESERNNTHTDWQSASSWFGERQSDRINTSSGRYGEKRETQEKREAQRNAPVSSSQSKSAKHPAQRKTAESTSASRKNVKGKVKSFSPSVKAGKNSSKSKDELRLEYAEKTRKRRKRRIIEWFIFTALIFAAIFIAASLTVLFRIEEIKVEGDTRYSVEEIIEASEVKKGDNLWRTSAKTVSKKVATSLPYVLDVKLTRRIPSGLTLVVRETTPAFAVRNGKGFILIDAYDKVLELNAKKSAGSLVITDITVSGNQEAGHKLETEFYENYSTAKNIFGAANDNEIRLLKISVRDINNISAVSDKKLRLDFGSAGQLDEKIKMAREVIIKLTQEDSLSEGVINLKSATKAFYKEGSAEITESEEKTRKKNKETTEALADSKNTQSTSENKDNASPQEEKSTAEASDLTQAPKTN